MFVKLVGDVLRSSAETLAVYQCYLLTYIPNTRYQYQQKRAEFEFKLIIMMVEIHVYLNITHLHTKESHNYFGWIFS